MMRIVNVLAPCVGIATFVTARGLLLKRLRVVTSFVAILTLGVFGNVHAANAQSTKIEPGTQFQDCDLCPEMIVLPSGTFVMGSTREETNQAGMPELYAENERPTREVTFRKPFAIGKHEVTRDEYAAFVKATERTDNFYCRIYDDAGRFFVTTPGKSWRDPGFEQVGSHPVVCVSWHDAKAYADWIARKTGKAYRLPTESEWEYAARGGTTTARYWGKTAGPETCEYANAGDLDAGDGPYKWGDPTAPVTYDLKGLDRLVKCRDGYVFTAPVGKYKPNAFGLYDTLGNVWEWVEDCRHYGYEGLPADGSAFIVDGYECGGEGMRVNRGGSWSHFPWGIRAAVRNVNEADSRFYTMGLRLAMTIEGNSGSE